MGPVVVSRARQRTISLCDGWGHSLYPAEFSSSASRPKAPVMSAARSTPGSAVNAEPELQRTQHSLGSHSMVKLEHNPGIIELPRRHEWKKRILSDQPHRVSETQVHGQWWYVVIWLPIEVPGTQIHVPQN